MSEQSYPDLSEQIRLELERITRGKVLSFDDDEEEEEDDHSIRLTAQLEDHTLTITSNSLPNDGSREIILNGVRYCPVLSDKKTNLPEMSPSRVGFLSPEKSPLEWPGSPSLPVLKAPPVSPASQVSHSVKVPPPPPPPPVFPDKENCVPTEVKTTTIRVRRKSQDLTNEVEDLSSGFLAKLTRHGTYVDRWCEIDVPNKAFNYWKSRAVRFTTAPTTVSIPDIVSIQWNAKDIKEGNRRNMFGLGGVRFIVTTKERSTTWRAQDPLLAIRWIDGIQSLMNHEAEDDAVCGPSEVPTEKSGSLQRMNTSGRYKDRWCEFDAKKKTLSYWAKKCHWEAKRPPKGVVDFSEVSSIVWNPDDVRKGKRRSLLAKDGVRFTIHFVDNSAQHWRSDNPLEASEWSRILGSVCCKILPRAAAVTKA